MEEVPHSSDTNHDVLIVTSSRRRIPAHSGVLASASEVLRGIIEKPAKRSSSPQKMITIPGVTCDAASAFVGFLYTRRCSGEDLSKYGVHLLVLSHVYAVPEMKRRSSRAISQGLTPDNVIDILQLARLCDAPDLYLRCMRLVSDRFKSVEASEGWKFMQDNDPWLELEILQFIDDADSRKKKAKRRKQEQKVYLELSEAMACLEHICREGCTGVGPYDADPTKKKSPCQRFDTCRGVQLSIKHFASCTKKVRGGCGKCRRMWQLLRLHASLCDHPESCKVPLCRQFKIKMQQERTRDDALWKMLVRRVASANAIRSLAPSNAKGY